MARNDDKAEIQHYVPRMHLERFAVRPDRDKLQVHVFDKQKSRTFRTSIGNIAAERQYYDFEHEGNKISLEDSMSEMEGHASEAFDNLLENESLPALSGDELTWIKIFIVVQHLRTPHFRQGMLDINASLKEKVEKLGHDPESVEGWSPFGDENDLKLQANVFLVDSLSEFAATLDDKAAILLKTRPKNPFWTSDNPVTMHNNNNFGPYGNIGLAVPGIEIYLPLSPTLTLGIWCPKHAAQIVDDFEKLKKNRQHLAALRTLGRNVNRDELGEGIAAHDKLIEKKLPILVALEQGTPAFCSEENVAFLNHLQIVWSSRFVISQTDSFDLAEEMIGDNPKYREGIKIEL